jgi:antitoxin MazE
MYILEVAVKVAKWGNSLAVRLPVAVVESLQLKEGDDVEIHPGDHQTLTIDRDIRKQRAFRRLREFQIDFPPDYKFDREEANAR